MAQIQPNTARPNPYNSTGAAYGRGMSNNVAGSKQPTLPPGGSLSDKIHPHAKPKPTSNIPPTHQNAPKPQTSNQETRNNQFTYPTLNQTNSNTSSRPAPQALGQQRWPQQADQQRKQLPPTHQPKQPVNPQQRPVNPPAVAGQVRPQPTSPPAATVAQPAPAPVQPQQQSMDFGTVEFTESQLESIQQLENARMQQQQQQQSLAPPAAAPAQEAPRVIHATPAPATSTSTSIASKSGPTPGNAGHTPHPVAATTKAAVNSPPRPTFPQQQQQQQQQQHRNPAPLEKVSAPPPQPQPQPQPVVDHAAAQERRRLQQELESTRKALDAARKDKANQDLEFHNRMREVEKQNKQLEQQLSQLRTEMQFTRADDSAVVTAATLNATGKTKPVLSVGGMELEIPRKNTQKPSPSAKPPAPPANKSKAKDPTNKNALQMAQAPTHPSAADKSPDRSPDREVSKKRKRVSDLDQSLPEDTSEVADDQTSQILADLMEVDSQTNQEEAAPNGADDSKYRNQFRQLRQGFRLLQKVFQPAQSPPQRPSANTSVSDSFSAQQMEAISQKHREGLMTDLSSVLDAKLGHFADVVVESLAKRRKVSETSDDETSTSATSNAITALKSEVSLLQTRLRDAEVERESFHSRLADAERERDQLRSMVESHADKIAKDQQEIVQILQRCEQLEMEGKIRQQEFERERQHAAAFLAEKDSRITDLQNLIEALMSTFGAAAPSQVAAGSQFVQQEEAVVASDAHLETDQQPMEVDAQAHAEQEMPPQSMGPEIELAEDPTGQ